MSTLRRIGLASAGLLVGLASMGAIGSQPAAFRRLVLLPLANSSTDPHAPPLVRPILKAGLRMKGFEIVEHTEVEEFLARERIRHTDSLNLATLRQVREVFGARYVLAGRVLGLRRTPLPEIGLALRLVETESGRIVWSGVRGTSGGRYERLLGLGLVDEPEYLVQLAVDEILEDLQWSEVGALDRRPKKIRDQRWAPDAIVYLDEMAPWESIRTVAVLPLVNVTFRSAAEGIVREVVVSRLWQSGRFEVIEPGEMRSQLRKRRLYPHLVAGDDVLGGIHDELGVDAVLGGTVLAYEEPPEGTTGFEPVVEVALQLISTENGEILWTALHSRRGSDGLTLYGAGRIRTATELTRALVDDMLATLPLKERRKKR